MAISRKKSNWKQVNFDSGKGNWKEKDIIIGGLKFIRVVEAAERGGNSEAKGSMQPPSIHAIRDRLLQGLDKDYNVISLLFSSEKMPKFTV